MEYLRWDTVRTGDFDPGNYLKYSRSDRAIVRSSDTATTASLASLYKPEAHAVVFIAFDHDKKTIWEDKGTINRLLEDWRVPKAAVDHLLKPTAAEGLYKAAAHPLHSCWYHIPVERLHSKVEHATIHVVQILDSSSGQARILIFYPPFLKGAIIAALPHIFTAKSSDDCISWVHVHMVLLAMANDTWQGTRWVNMASGSLSLRGLVVAADGSLDAEPVRRCNSSISQMNLFLNQLQLFTRVLHDFGRYLEEDTTSLGQDDEYPAKHVLHNLENNLSFLVGSYEFLREQLLLSRHTLITAIDIQNASYMRANTIALRRIAEQNQRDAQRSQKDVEISKRNSDNMRMISYVTMVFLPPTFVATLFSMPFFDLDDGGQFTHINRLWIFIVASLVFLAITIGFSFTWRRYLGALKPTKLDHATVEEEELTQGDIRVLEPEPQKQPGTDELLQGLLQVLGDDNGREDEAGNNLRQRTALRASE